MLTIDTASRTFHCKTWVTGQTQGKAVIARERISFWGGFDPQTGRIVDPYSSLRGRDISDCVLILLSSKGSSGTSGMLSLATRAGHAPAAMIQVEMDPVTVMGCLVNNIPLLLGAWLGVIVRDDLQIGLGHRGTFGGGDGIRLARGRG